MEANKTEKKRLILHLSEKDKKRLKKVADDDYRTPSKLVEKWVIEKLDSILSVVTEDENTKKLF